MISFICGVVALLIVILLITWGFIMGREDTIDKALFGDTVSAYGKKWDVTAKARDEK